MNRKLQESILKQLGENIFSHRKAKDMLQIDLAKKVGLSRTSVSNIEVGRHEISVLKIYEFANALDCKIDDLLPKI